MDFKQIEAFVNVVKYKSFSKAADATFFTQPTISAHISNLENELGAQLLDRHGRTVEMTPAGAKFYKYAAEMINTRLAAIDALGADNSDISGILEIQTSSIPGVTFLPGLLAKFRKEHQQIQYYVSLSDTETVIDNLLDRRGEIGFVGDKVSNTAIESKKIATDKAVMIAPTSLNLASTITIDEAVKLPFIWRETGSATRRTFEDAAIALGYSKQDFEIAAIFNDLDSVIRSVQAGLGVAVISESVAKNLGDKISIVNIEGFSDKRDFYIVKLKNSSLSPAAEEFYRFATE